MYIPFFKERMSHIQKEKAAIENKPANESAKKDIEDLAFLDKQLKSLKEEIKNERKQL